MSQKKAQALPISISRVSKSYGSTAALDDVSLEVRSGEFLTLLGPSGSGKTTLLMALAGFARPDCGSLKFGDAEMIRTPPHLRNVGMTFQSYALFPHMSVAGNVGYPLKLRGVPKPEMAERIERALGLVSLEGFGERRIDQLSGGQRQRVALARSIVFEPRILLMDEPLSALDKKLRDRMQIELRQMHERLGMTTVYVTHDQREALTMSDRIAVINRGRIMQLASPRDLYERPANRFVADFIGESSFLPVRRDGAALRFGEAEVRTANPVPDAAELLLMARPERIRILDGRGGERAEGMNLFEAVVSGLVYQGDSFLLHARLGGDLRISVRGPARGGELSSLPRAGDRVRLALAPEDVVIVDAGGE